MFDLEGPLKSWKVLNATIMALTEEHCWALLEAEKAGRARRQLLRRIQERANALRTRRERAAVAALGKK